MTLASALYGAASGTKYLAGNVYPAYAGGLNSTALSTGKDYLVPFSPRANMTLDRVAWLRENSGTGSNVYVGLYSGAGVLLTDCAVDTNTSQGWHLVNTTNVALTANTFYWLCYNQSADVAYAQSSGTADTVASVRPAYEHLVREFGIATALGITSGGGDALHGVFASKSRSNAALLSTLVLSGWSEVTDVVPALGVVAA